jgi:hypothetical protein
MRAPLSAAAVFVFSACIHLSPASRSPLREKLGRLTDSELEEAVSTCLAKEGWHLDEVPSQHGDMRVLHGKKDGEDASMYLYPQGATPRITGVLAEGDDPLWPCLAARR